MYPVSIGYEGAKERIQKLLDTGFYAEAMVTAIFTVEKTIRRTLRQIVISAGFTSQIANKIIGNLRGLDALKEAWVMYEPQNRLLVSIVSELDWNQLKGYATQRNRLIHGERVYKLENCKQAAMETLRILDAIKATFDRTYGYSGWTKASSRKTSRLHADPKVTVT